ncbi:hypothetical protein EVAR_101156_1 [Eumeta japonica]|uniref:Uncharacterized protein n=1 Tax=Eumeta variegata TaxID=151549 RepID=A0A4C2ACG1_EUMVA|nr:hypothetical protein EVAR_101156_1 [Eumeta japonica]
MDTRNFGGVSNIPAFRADRGKILRWDTVLRWQRFEEISLNRYSLEDGEEIISPGALYTHVNVQFIEPSSAFIECLPATLNDLLGQMALPRMKLISITDIVVRAIRRKFFVAVPRRPSSPRRRSSSPSAPRLR